MCEVAPTGSRGVFDKRQDEDLEGRMRRIAAELTPEGVPVELRLSLAHALGRLAAARERRQGAP